MKNYLLRDIPEELHRAAQHKAIDEGITLRELIFRALRHVTDDKRGDNENN